MKIKDGFVLREVAGQTVVIGVGALSEQFHRMIRLNDTLGSVSYALIGCRICAFRARCARVF